MTVQPSNTVLIIDDDAAKRHSIAKILRKAGYTTLEGETGAADCLRYAAEKPALIILDVKLPDLSGFADPSAARLACDSPHSPPPPATPSSSDSHRTASGCTARPTTA